MIMNFATLTNIHDAASGEYYYISALFEYYCIQVLC